MLRLPKRIDEVNNMRLLVERDESRDHGDKLAMVVKTFLKGKADNSKLREALMAYCCAEGWNGPAGRWVKELLKWEKELLKWEKEHVTP
ncbi:hypothetical protein LCGC14_0479610 [marine sediment metagenome]|uniref:Uncharacterized protein n=1 Tax=marine sediment metagenome TaxID=412755 RepID=A0A0F9S9S0_9ZZZZ